MWNAALLYAVVMPTYFITMHIRQARNMKYNLIRPPLEDVGHLITDEKTWRKFHHISDILPVVCVLLMIADSYIFNGSIKKINEYCILHASMYFIRMLSIHSTTLPTSVPYVRHKSYKPRMYLGFVPSYDNDMCFSGHLSMCLLTLPFISDYNLYWASVWSSILCGFLLIASREHYTLDIVVACIACRALYSYKDFLINTFTF